MAIYQRTLSQIPEDCQKILRLTAEDITSKEIARQLGFRSEGYVRKTTPLLQGIPGQQN